MATTPTAVGNPPGTTESFRTVLVNSTLAAVLGVGLMIVVHELVHLICGLLLGFPGVLYAFGVEHVGTATRGQEALMLLAAPVFSLISGLIMAFWLPLRRIGGFAHLLWLWFAFTSMMEGVGYFVITPFGAGDTGQAATLLNWPVWASIALCLGGVGLQFLTARLFAPHVGRHAGPERGPRSNQWAFAFWPWLIGSAINTTLSLVYLSLSSADVGAGATTAILAAGMATLVFAPMSFIFQRWFDPNHEPLGLRPVPVAGLVALLILVAYNFASLGGIRIG